MTVDTGRQLVSVCVCTFKRPQLLEALLRSLSEQEGGDFNVEIVVIDNDASESGRPVADALSRSGPWERFVYDVQPVQGISHARNLAVALARGQLIAFIDDDEVASPRWLKLLVATLRESKCDAVLGPVLPIFPPSSPGWAPASKYFDRPRHRTGDRVPVAEGRTGNALVGAKWLTGAEPFESRFALTGGEDYAFFERIVGSGAAIVWCDEASVSELVPLERQRMRWMLERSLRGSMTFWRITGARDALHIKLARVAVGLAGGAVYGLLGLAMLPLGRHHAARHWNLAAKGFGRLLAFTRYDIETYRHG